MAQHRTTGQTPPAATQPQVPLLDLTAQFAELRDDLVAAVTDVLDSQKCINGPAIERFEQQAAEYCRCRHAVAVSSGTDALLCSLMALGIGEGYEVITTPFTFFATAGSIWRSGATPVFVDIDPATFNMNVNQLADAVNERTRAIMPVHLFGQMADMSAVMDIAERRDLAVIEDAAQSMGATQNNQSAGAVGTCGCMSFFPSKNLGGLGDGGMIVTQDDNFAERCKSLRNHGTQARYYHNIVGGNFRMDTIQAAYLSVKLPHLDKWAAARQANAARYDAHFAELDAVTTPTIATNNTSIYNQYVIRAAKRDAIKDHLQAHDIGSAVYYPLCLHEQQCFHDLAYKRGDFPEAERAADEVLALPVFPEMSEAQLEHVAATVKAFYA